MDSLMTMLREVRCIRDLRGVSLAGGVDLAAPQIASPLLFPNIVCFFLSLSTLFHLHSKQEKFNINQSSGQGCPNTKLYS